MSSFPNKAPIAANADPSTSHLAGQILTESGVRNIQKELVLAAVRNHPGHTSAELARITGLDRHLVARRCPDLGMDGLVYKSGRKRCDVTGSLSCTWAPR